MFRHYLTAALNNLVRNKLYATINIVGLAVGFAATILIGLYVRDEFNFDKWIPGAEKTYSLYSVFFPPGRPPLVIDAAPADFAAALKLDFPEMAAVTRMEMQYHGLRHAAAEASEVLYLSDANVFSVLPLPLFAGDIKTALARPDGIVMTRRMARKYFGIDNPVGQTITMDSTYPLQVTAVLQDFPAATSLTAEMFVSSKAVFSRLAQVDAQPPRADSDEMLTNTHTLFRLKPGVRAKQIADRLPAFLARHRKLDPAGVHLEMIPLSEHHLHPTVLTLMAKPADEATVNVLGGIGILILGIAVINFVNLMTARAPRRALEVGVRKASGASRRELIIQFVGEAMVYVTFGMVLALALVELALPGINAFLGRTIVFDYWRNPTILAAIVGVLVVAGLAAGAYPAFVLSAFNPALALKANKAMTRGGGVRGFLVVLQFAVLIGLIMAAGVVYRQTRYVLNDAMRLSTDQVVLLAGPCHTALENNIRALPGVRATACASGSGLTFNQIAEPARLPDGRTVVVYYIPVDFGFFEFYGLKPVAGRFFSERHGDQVRADHQYPSVVVNESAVRRLGLSKPEQIIGKTITLKGAVRPSLIVGVVSDFAFKSLRDPIDPTVYFVDPAQNVFINVRLAGRQIPETLSAIDRTWRQSGSQGPIFRLFLDQRVQSFYQDEIRQGQLFAAFAVLAVLIACLGLYGLAASTAEQRTKEIGIRKAMGADTRDILKLLLWQFAKPVLWANLIAWPVAGYMMWRWLQGFAYRIDLPWWLFLAASGLALFIAMTTVLVQSWLVACAKPVTALRYE